MFTGTGCRDGVEQELGRIHSHGPETTHSTAENSASPAILREGYECLIHRVGVELSQVCNLNRN